MTTASMEAWSHTLGVGMIASPAAALTVLGIAALLRGSLGERIIYRVTASAIVLGMACLVLQVLLMATNGTPQVAVSLGDWVKIPHYHLTVKLWFDSLSIIFAALTFALCGTIGAFSARYLHREMGYGRFFLLFVIFLLGMILASLAGTVETLFLGWELVGLSSTLLVAFYQERVAPPGNGLRVWSVYRASDAALLLAAIALHHLHGEGDFAALGGTRLDVGEVPLDGWHAFFVGLLLLVAASGKSALVPFSGWLPRAMEGPTPSSAIFYGALSVHLGAFLLLRSASILEASPGLQTVIVFVGLFTAISAALVERAQTDVKSSLSYAALTQVGLIVAEIGMGWYSLALAHLVGHACLRTLQFLRAGSLLQDYRAMEDDLGARLPSALGADPHFYRAALERGYFDTLLTELLVGPLLRVLRWCDGRERALANWLRGGPEPLAEPMGELEDLA